MIIIDGKAIGERILASLTTRTVPKKYFAGILIGNDPASLSFQTLKKEMAERLGIDYRIYTLDPILGNDGLRAEISKIAAHAMCGAVLVQLPVPAPINRHYIMNGIPRGKDVDVLSERALGAFYAHRNPVHPPVVHVVEEILKQLDYSIADKVVAVVGLGLLIGRPIANWFMGKTKGLYLLGKGSDFDVLKKADLVVIGVGKAGLITPDMLKSGAGVIDFGYSTNEAGKLAGDFAASQLTDHAPLAFYTPVPGGTGPILISKLLENFYTLTELQDAKQVM